MASTCAKASTNRPAAGYGSGDIGGRAFPMTGPAAGRMAIDAARLPEDGACPSGDGLRLHAVPQSGGRIRIAGMAGRRGRLMDRAGHGAGGSRNRSFPCGEAGRPESGSASTGLSSPARPLRIWPGCGRQSPASASRARWGRSALAAGYPPGTRGAAHSVRRRGARFAPSPALRMPMRMTGPPGIRCGPGGRFIRLR